MKKSKANAYLAQPWAITDDALASIAATIDAMPTGSDLFSVRSKASDKIPDTVVKQGVAIIPVKSALAKDHGWTSFYSGLTFSGYLGIRQQVEKALVTPGVRAILLDIDSPGGTVDGCLELVDYLSSISRPLYAWVDGQATSAAEWIKSTALESWAPATAMHGSIGVRMHHTDWSGWNEQRGLGETYITAPADGYKATPNPDTPLDEKALAYLQGQASDTYAIFRDSVAANQGLTAKAIDAMQAKVFLTAEAIELGLVTGTMPDIDTCISHIAKKEGDMDKNTLKAEHPELYKQVVQEGVDQATAITEASIKDAVANAISLMGVVGGEQLAAKVKVMVETNMTAEQAQALGVVAATPEQPPGEEETPAAEANVSQKILDALKALTPGSLDGGGGDGGGGQDFDALVSTHMAANADCTKSAAMQAVAKAHPEAHSAWLKKQQK